MLSPLGVLLLHIPFVGRFIRRWARRHLPIFVIDFVGLKAVGRQLHWVAASGHLYIVEGPAWMGPNRCQVLTPNRVMVVEE